MHASGGAVKCDDLLRVEEAARAAADLAAALSGSLHADAVSKCGGRAKVRRVSPVERKTRPTAWGDGVRCSLHYAVTVSADYECR